MDRAFAALGSTVRVVVRGHGAAERADRAVAVVEDYDHRLSRFREDSELCALNADPRRRVRCSALVRDAIRAGLWAAERTEGLVDPTLLGALEEAGYDRTFDEIRGRGPADERGAGRAGGSAVGDGTGSDATPPSLVARPHPAAAWRGIAVHEPTGTVVRPPGLRLDLGGTGKGHCADRVASLLDGADAWAIDCGGDLRVGGTDAAHAVEIADPRGGPPLRTLHLGAGAVATSSVLARAWGTGHHLLDPATGRPVRSGIVAATALAPTTLEAETLAKAVVLTGDTAWLSPWGGIAIGEDDVVTTVRGSDEGVLA